MIKQMKKNVYEAPVTERFLVEMEGAICGASADVQNPDSNTGRIENHQVNDGFDGDFSGFTWTEEE